MEEFTGFLFSTIGDCVKVCPCTRCDENGTPYSVTVTYDGDDYLLTKWESGLTVENCTWRHNVASIDEFPFVEGDEPKFLLFIIEDDTPTVMWILYVWDPDDETQHVYYFDFGEDPTDCTEARELTQQTEGGPEPVSLTPGASRGACCECPEEPEVSGSCVCLYCENDTAPCQFQVVIAGLTGCCAVFNGTFIVDLITFAPGGACTWYNGDIPGAFDLRVNVVNTTARPHTVSIVAWSFCGVVLFEKSFGPTGPGNEPPCDELDEEDIPYSSGPAECGSGPTAHVTAIV